MNCSFFADFKDTGAKPSPNKPILPYYTVGEKTYESMSGHFPLPRAHGREVVNVTCIEYTLSSF